MRRTVTVAVIASAFVVPATSAWAIQDSVPLPGTDNVNSAEELLDPADDLTLDAVVPLPTKSADPLLDEKNTLNLEADDDLTKLAGDGLDGATGGGTGGGGSGGSGTGEGGSGSGDGGGTGPGTAPGSSDTPSAGDTTASTSYGSTTDGTPAVGYTGGIGNPVAARRGGFAGGAGRAAIVAAGRAIQLAGPFAPPLALAGFAFMVLFAMSRGSERLVKLDPQRGESPPNRSYRL